MIDINNINKLKIGNREDIKNFLVMNKVTKKPTQAKKKEIEYTYKLSYNNNIDFIDMLDKIADELMAE